MVADVLFMGGRSFDARSEESSKEAVNSVGEDAG
jgi:hypothetical protein